MQASTIDHVNKRISARRLAWPMAGLMVICQLLLLADTAWDKSDTIDEITFVERLSAKWLPEHEGELPPFWQLPEWAFAAALRISDPDLLPLGPTRLRCDWILWRGTRERARSLLFMIRLPTILLTAGAGLLLWSAARRFGELEALLAHALWCFSPAVLAHGCLATIDGWLGALMAVMLWFVVRYAERPTLKRVALVGMSLGLAITTKLAAFIAIPVLVAVVTVLAWRPGTAAGLTAPRMVMRAVGVLGISTLATAWGVYGFSYGYADLSMLEIWGKEGYGVFGPVPFPRFIEMIAWQASLADFGHQIYLFGDVRVTGWWWFYFAVLAFKLTVGGQILFVLALAGRLWARGRFGRSSLPDVALLAFPTLLFVVLSAGKVQSGVRYLLPAYPFVLAWIGRALPDTARLMRNRGLWLSVAAVLLGIIEMSRVHPHHLMFFNIWGGGPEGGPRYLIHSDDWGQDQRRLGEWQRKKKLNVLFYTYYSGNPEIWGIRFAAPSCKPRRGVYALHAVEVHRPRRIDEGCLDWLTVEPPDMRLGYSIYIYHVNKHRIARLREKRGKVKPFWSTRWLYERHLKELAREREQD